MDLKLKPHEQELLDKARRFSREQVAPRAAQWEFERRVPLETLRAAAKEGLMGLMVPRALGGQAAGYPAVSLIMEELASGCMQAMGAERFRAEHPFGRHLAAAKMAQYLDGTTEIQNVVISRSLLT